MDSTSGKAFLSVLFAAPPGGQLLFSPLIGWCSNRMSSVRILFVLLTALYIFSNALYSVIELFCVPQRKYIMLIARFGFGIATSINTISRAYISAATKFSERTKTIAICSLSQTLGLLVGPLLQSLISLLGKDGVVLCGLRLNMYTSGGWICALGGTMFLLLLSPSTFVHRTIAFKEAQNNKGKSSLMENNRSLHLFPICMIITGYGLLMFFYVSFQTTLSPIALDQFSWSHEESLYYLGILLTVGTLCSCLIYLLLPYLSKTYNEHNVFVYIAILPLFLSQMMMIPTVEHKLEASVSRSDNSTAALLGCTQEWCKSVPTISRYQLSISYGMLCISFSVGIAITQTILSKLLGARPQGHWMALYTSVGGIARIMGPGTMLIYIQYGPHYLFGLGTIVTGLMLLWIWFYRKLLHIDTKLATNVREEQDHTGFQ
ncbi:major facilitator superfamily domain-containing protein 8-like isoform X2 [Anopheles darlingi]|nr:major facilitator superfamily domain-containing protein 8-like isoform X2 [Anopheles darlingi]XP_049544775.1 major facilitator superfamily domain-containing protein 8-like isoform X2 [Anopheles darlingi]